MVAKKIGNILDSDCGHHRHFFMCPGCGYAHCFTVAPDDYNNDPIKPTIKVPIIIPGHLALFHCHSKIENGQITFKRDCTHDHAGYTYDLPNIS